MAQAPSSCSICDKADWQKIIDLADRPEGETDYGFTPYDRSLWQCQHCGHFMNSYGGAVDLSRLYDGAYWDSTYADKIRQTFDHVMQLPVAKSDNRGRVAYIEAFWAAENKEGKTLLDIGSGLAVFPAAMREQGWQVTALDPDPKAAEHARVHAKVEAISADYLTDQVAGQFDLISLNKVLEHVPDMESFLQKVKGNLKADGYLYLELPDGEQAIQDKIGPLREEFFVEHYCAFSRQSYASLAEKTGFHLIAWEQLVEPSGKYTIRGMLQVMK